MQDTGPRMIRGLGCSSGPGRVKEPSVRRDRARSYKTATPRQRSGNRSIFRYQATGFIGSLLEVGFEGVVLSQSGGSLCSFALTMPLGGSVDPLHRPPLP